MVLKPFQGACMNDKQLQTSCWPHSAALPLLLSLRSVRPLFSVVSFSSSKPFSELRWEDQLISYFYPFFIPAFSFQTCPSVQQVNGLYLPMRANCTCHHTSPGCCHSNVDESSHLKAVLVYERYLHSAAHQLKYAGPWIYFFYFLTLAELKGGSKTKQSFFLSVSLSLCGYSKHQVGEMIK